jgi:hypothetical protein
MARVNLLLALGDRARLLPQVDFHVFHADSIVLPRVELGQLSFDAPLQEFVVPTAVRVFRLHPDLMTQEHMSILRRNLEAALRNRVASSLFATALRAELDSSGLSTDRSGEAVTSAISLLEALWELRDTGRDDVWARILEQFVAPHFLSNFEVVVGNPPWISWKDLPDAWKERSRPVWRAWGLWKTRRGGRGVPLSDISTLLVARALVSYAGGGIVAMLLPKSAQLADPGGNAFRRSHLRPEPEDRLGSDDEVDVWFKAVEMDDFASVHPFAPEASNQTIAMYFRPGARPAFPIRTRVWSRRPRQHLQPNWPWSRVEDLLVREERQAAPVDPTSIDSPWGLLPTVPALELLPRGRIGAYTFGRGYETRGLDGLFLYDVLTDRPTNGLVRVRNRPIEGYNTRGEEARESAVEPNLFWPLLKGEDVGRWRTANPSRYALVPYLVQQANVRKVTTSRMASLYPRLFTYLQPWLQRFASRSLYHADPDPEFPWALSGPTDRLHDTGALLLVRYLATNGRPGAAVVVPSYDSRLDRTTLPVPNNKSNIYYSDSASEAHFLAAFINSTPAQEALSSFASSTGVTPAALSRLPIPRFRPGLASHAQLASLGERAAAVGPEELGAVESEIDRLTWELARGQ